MSPGVTAGGVEDDWNWMQDKITRRGMLCSPQVRQRAEVDEWGTLRREKIADKWQSGIYLLGRKDLKGLQGILGKLMNKKKQERTKKR